MNRNILHEAECGEDFNVGVFFEILNCRPIKLSIFHLSTPRAVVAAVLRLLNAPAAMIQGSTPTLEFSGSTLISQSSWDGVSFRPGGEQQTKPLDSGQHSFGTITPPHTHCVALCQWITLCHSGSHCVTGSHWVTRNHMGLHRIKDSL